MSEFAKATDDLSKKLSILEATVEHTVEQTEAAIKKSKASKAGLGSRQIF